MRRGSGTIQVVVNPTLRLIELAFVLKQMFQRCVRTSHSLHLAVCTVFQSYPPEVTGTSGQESLPSTLIMIQFICNVFGSQWYY